MEFAVYGFLLLAVLAGPPDAYAAYASAVREEYGHLSDDEFMAHLSRRLDGIITEDSP